MDSIPQSVPTTTEVTRSTHIITLLLHIFYCYRSTYYNISIVCSHNQRALIYGVDQEPPWPWTARYGQNIIAIRHYICLPLSSYAHSTWETSTVPRQKRFGYSQDPNGYCPWAVGPYPDTRFPELRTGHWPIPASPRFLR
jgi:hypothetical protein